MPSKKKKYNARFPPARIKKIMQTDEEVGKVAAAVPVIIYILFKQKTAFWCSSNFLNVFSLTICIPRALELFVESLLTKAVQITSAKNAKTLSPAHLKQCILAESRFDFLKDLVMAIPDVQVEGEEGAVPGTPTSSSAPHHPPAFRHVSAEPGSSSSTRGRGTGRPRGRPRKVAGPPPAGVKSEQRTWEKRQSDDDETDSGDSEDSEDEDEEETDTDSQSKGGPVARNGQSSVAALQKATQFNAVQPNFYQEISAQNSAPFQIQINLPATGVSDDKAKADGDEKGPTPAAQVAKLEDDDYDT
uniref:EOG090X0H1B n=1 Tax=Moina brachiata TaxID=675436 RepID=A0A4Y7NL92_9CRUS|nr:EOG090X0H1B [Moina brachiata]SVE93347.1 EOG090X0H1B [Moina brachiata]